MAKAKNIKKNITGSLLAVVWGLLPTAVQAAVYDGEGLVAGLKEVTGLTGIVTAPSITELILKVIAFVLDIILLIAVLAVIVAGVYLIVSNGDDAQKDKAKNIIFYVIAGIILILFSRVLVVVINSIFV